MSTAKKLMGTTATGGFTAVEDVFQSYLYTGNSSTQTITNGIDLAGEGGLVWFKNRGTYNHVLQDTVRGAGVDLYSNLTVAEIDYSGTYGISSFNDNGFSLVGAGTATNATANNYASWTFRKAPRFFDVVTYTGDGSPSPRQIAHSLGSMPGFIVIKRTDTVSDWTVWHRSVTGNAFLQTSDAWQTSYTRITTPNETTFTVGASTMVNASGGTYVAYLFAHDPLGPSGDGSDGLIACGSYTGNGSNDGPEVNLGWEPQWLLVKNATTGPSDWLVVDSMRGFTVSGVDDAQLSPNLSNAESATSRFAPLSNGFKLTNTSSYTNTSGNTYIYIAIRRGPMRQPESGTDVFAQDHSASTEAVGANPPSQFYSGWPVDMYFNRAGGTSNTADWQWRSRLQGGSTYLKSNATDAETTNTTNYWDTNQGIRPVTGLPETTNYYGWMFRRAPSFFDVVAYTGDGVAGRTVNHNLGVAPELMIVKRRDNIDDWGVYAGPYPSAASGYFKLNTNQAFNVQSGAWNNTAPTDLVFTVGNNAMVNASGATYIAYLFASLSGISKVGSYTGNGTSQTIDCGFTSGSRFVLIKRTDSTGDWFVWDTERGIVAANDPHLSLNTTAAEVTTDDSVDPDGSGFIVNQVAATNINVSAASYIYLAIS